MQAASCLWFDSAHPRGNLGSTCKAFVPSPLPEMSSKMMSILLTLYQVSSKVEAGNVFHVWHDKPGCRQPVPINVCTLVKH